MKYHLADIIYLVKRDSYSRTKVKNVMIVGCSIMILIILFVGAAGLYFIKPLLGFLVSNIPIINEALFTYARGFVLPYIQEDLVGMLTNLIDGTNVPEMKELIVKYFEQLKNSSQIDYQSFQKFITTAKNVISDGTVLPSELNAIQKLLPTELITK